MTTISRSNVPTIALSRNETREIDRAAIEDYGLPGAVLMENAGRNTAEFLFSLGVTGPVVICCGKGNNGGDGYVIARYLDNHHIPVKVLLLVDPTEITGDAKIHYEVIKKSGLSIVEIFRQFNSQFILQQFNTELEGSAWVIDAIFGTGLQGELKTPFAEIIAAINTYSNQKSAKVLAVDIPSGLDCDSGSPLSPLNAVLANYTATYIGIKKGFLNKSALAWTGEVKLIDIGLPRIVAVNYK